MKKLILKSGVYRYINRLSQPQDNELDIEQWLKKQLKRLGVFFIEQCCDNNTTNPVIQDLQDQINILQERIEALENPE